MNLLNQVRMKFQRATHPGRDGGLLRHLERDWAFSIAFAALIALGLVLWSGLLYFAARQGELFVARGNTGTSTPALDERTLAETLAAYRAKAEAFERLKLELPPAFADPAR